MSTKRVLSPVLIVIVVLLAVGIGPRFSGTARALPSAQAGASAQASVTIPYPGSLTDDEGQLVADGAYDFTFAVYDVEAGGEPLWAETQEGVPVQGGGFTALLGGVAPLPNQALEGGARWLEVAVRGPGEAGFTLLSPRQELSTASLAAPAAPQALSCAHTHLYETWSGSDPGDLTTFTVENRNEGRAIMALSTYTDTTGTALWAEATGGMAVRASSLTDTAVRVYSGVADAPALFVQNWNSTDGEAVYMLNDSDSPTARFWNHSTGEVLYLENAGDELGNGGGDFITAVGVNTTPEDIQFRLTSNGGVTTDAGFRCGDGAPGCLQTGSADVAERVNASEALEPGDVVEIDPTRSDHFRLARTPYSTLVAGVISTDPAIVMGVQGITLADGGVPDERPPLAMLGRVPARVSAENGPIGIGDLLVTSSTPGHAMRGVNPPPGTILGKALEPLETGTGVILVLVMPQ